MLELGCEELGGTDDCLCGIVDQNIQMLNILLHVLNQHINLLRRQKITLHQKYPILPLTIILLPLIPKQRISYKPSRSIYFDPIS